MNWLYTIKRSVDYIEEHILEDIDISKVAGEEFVSPMYFDRAFSFITGYSVTEYIRNRRLYLAAIDLYSTDMKVIDCALKYYYETPESFNKAFKRFHLITPSECKHSIKKIHSFYPLVISIKVQGGANMNYVIEDEDSFEVVGFEGIFNSKDSYQKIPEFWDEVNEKYKDSFNTPDSNDEIVECIKKNHIGEYGLCIDDIMENGNFRYMICGRYVGGSVPDGLVKYNVPSSKWVKFKSIGKLPGSLQSLNTRIFKEWLPGHPEYAISQSINIEWYSNGNTNDDKYESGVWIPVIENK